MHPTQVYLTATPQDESIGLLELAIGFDKQFAERIKKVWVDSVDLKTAFQNDLNALKNRWSFSLYLQGARERFDGLSRTLTDQIGLSVGSLAVGSLLIWASQSLPPHRKDGAAMFFGSLFLLAGVLIPGSIYSNCVSEARGSILDSIVKKNLTGHLSVLDCKRLTKAISWSWDRGVSFNLDNENHLRGIYPQSK